jgi:hypothetical protein
LLGCGAAGYHRGVHEKANPPRGGGAKPTGLYRIGEAAGPPKGKKIALSETRLALALIAAELSCALLWALTGGFALGALALALGLGAVLAVFLPERYPPRDAFQRKPVRRAPVDRVRTRGGYRGGSPPAPETRGSSCSPKGADGRMRARMGHGTGVGGRERG